MRDFLAAHSANPPAIIPLDAQRALERAARIVGNPAVAERDPASPLSFCLLKPDEFAAGKAKLEHAFAQEQACRLDLPMCFEKDDWEKGADQQRRWTCVPLPPFLSRLLPRLGPCDGSRPSP